MLLSSSNRTHCKPPRTLLSDPPGTARRPQDRLPHPSPELPEPHQQESRAGVGSLRAGDSPPQPVLGMGAAARCHLGGTAAGPMRETKRQEPEKDRQGHEAVKPKTPFLQQSDMLILSRRFF